MSEWKTIDSAPKDGERIILGYVNSHSEEGSWMGNASANYWGETGWMAVGDDPLITHPSHPSHWMPLPEPPKEPQP